MDRGEVQFGEEPGPTFPPGTMGHLENFKNMPPPKFFQIGRYDREELRNRQNPYAQRMAHQNDRLLAKFLSETEITRSLGIFTKRLQTFRPIRTGSLELDTRLFRTREPWIPLFRSTINRPRATPFEWAMFISGQSQPWEEGRDNISYDIALPIDIKYSHDPSRHSQATFRYGDGEQFSYNQKAFLEYGTYDPNVMITCLKQASIDLSRLARYIYVPETEPWYTYSDAEPESSPLRVRTVAAGIANLLK